MIRIGTACFITKHEQKKLCVRIKQKFFFFETRAYAQQELNIIFRNYLALSHIRSVSIVTVVEK